MRRVVKSVFYVILAFIIFSLVFSLLGVFISCSPNIVDHLNLWYEKKHQVNEVDRTIYVKAMVDQEFLDLVNQEREYGLFLENGDFYLSRPRVPKRLVTKSIERASKSFEYQFGIKLELVGIEKWNPQSRDPHDLIGELRAKVPLNDADIVIGFSGRREKFAGLATLGGNSSLGNHIIINPFASKVIPEKVPILCRVSNSYHVQSYVLVHEIGHIFRAGNLQNHFVFSVMNSKTLLFTTHFDEHNRQIIFQNKYLPSK